MFDNRNNIEKELNYFNDKLAFNVMIYTAPLVANRNQYVNCSLEKRKSIFLALVYFASSIDIKLNSIVVDKRYVSNQKNVIR